MKPHELRKKDIKGIKSYVSEKRNELRDFRFQLVSGKTSAVRKGRVIRRDIATALSIINEKTKYGEKHKNKKNT